MHLFLNRSSFPALASTHQGRCILEHLCWKKSTPFELRMIATQIDGRNTCVVMQLQRLNYSRHFNECKRKVQTIRTSTPECNERG